LAIEHALMIPCRQSYALTVWTCAQCGHENLEGARFCNACGAPLADHTPMAVRKTVTVLFCDLVGSTSLGERTDPEVLRELMGRYHRELRTILERHGGSVEKFVGDAAMAVFGIPHVHEDDALRATRAANEIRAAVDRLGLEARIGVNTGEVVAGDGETLVTGDVVNVAARLEQVASSGETLLGEGTYILVRDAVRAEQVAPLAVKGKAEPLRAFRLLEVLADVPAFTRPIEAPFVGRNDELETLERTLARAVDERTPQLATIIGPPGIGKSRLARELIQCSPARVLVGRCLSYGEGITYWPLAEVVSQVGDVRSALGDESEADLAAFRIAAAVGTAAAAASPEEIGWGFRKLFEALARDQPLIVVLDDIQWAELTLLDLIEYVVTFAGEALLLLLCMARPELFEVRPSWATPRPNAALVTLEPLAEAETETLVEELRDVPDETKARIVEAAEGNPLFVEQLVAMHAESGNGELAIPPTIQALLAARIDRLAPEERSVIERASIEGRLFHRGSVAELLPEQARAGVGAHLMTLVRKELIRPDRALVPGDDGFRFGHILIRDSAYESVPKRLRAELHERFADWLEAALGEDAPREILGYHLEHAHLYRLELGSEDDGTRELALRAGRLLAEAGRRANARGDAAATRSLVGRACALLPEVEPERPSLLERLGSATYAAGDVSDALEILQRAQAAAAAAGQRAVELRARMSELDVLITADPRQETEAALAEAEAAIAELTKLDDVESLLKAWEVVIEVGNMRSRSALMEEAARHRLELARRAGLPGEVVWTAGWLSLALARGPRPVTEAIGIAEQALAEFPEQRFGLFHLALLYGFAGRDKDAERAIEQTKRALIELGHRTLEASLSMDRGWIALLAGEPERAEKDLREGAEVLEAAGESGVLSTVAAVLAEVLYRLGRDGEAERWTRRSEETASPEDVISQALWRSTRAKLLARRGEGEEALRLSAEAADSVRRSDDLPLIADCLFDRAEVLRLLGREDEAHRVLERALAIYERKGIVPSIGRTRALLAEMPA
jgi:class 3 adenylate cyclase/tetratricopeptide (TPR) repeat protein